MQNFFVPEEPEKNGESPAPPDDPARPESFPDPETLSRALREDLADRRRFWELLSSLQGRFRLLAVSLVILALLGLFLVLMLQGIVNSLATTPHDPAPAPPADPVSSTVEP